MYYFTLLLTLLPLLGITQENPRSIPEEQNTVIEKDTITQLVVELEDKSYSNTSTKSILLEKDTFSTSIQKVNMVGNRDSLQNEKLLYSYYSKLGESELKSNGSTAFGVITCSIFNVFGILPALISVAAPNELQLNATEHLKSKYPNITTKQIRAYKSGVTNKRVKKTFKGCVIGTAINITAIIILLHDIFPKLPL